MGLSHARDGLQDKLSRLYRVYSDMEWAGGVAWDSADFRTRMDMDIGLTFMAYCIGLRSCHACNLICVKKIHSSLSPMCTYQR